MVTQIIWLSCRIICVYTTTKYINGSAMLGDLQNQWITHTHTQTQKDEPEETNERTDWQFKTRRITSVAVLLAIIVLLAISR
jgi:hypothetical protein